MLTIFCRNYTAAKKFVQDSNFGTKSTRLKKYLKLKTFTEPENLLKDQNKWELKLSTLVHFWAAFETGTKQNKNRWRFVSFFLANWWNTLDVSLELPAVVSTDFMVSRAMKLGLVISKYLPSSFWLLRTTFSSPTGTTAFVASIKTVESTILRWTLADDRLGWLSMARAFYLEIPVSTTLPRSGPIFKELLEQTILLTYFVLSILAGNLILVIIFLLCLATLYA